MSGDTLRTDVRRRMRAHVDGGGSVDPAVVSGAVDAAASHGRQRYAAGVGDDAPTAAAAAALADTLAGFGPLSALMADPDVEEVWVNGPGRVFCARAGGHELTTVVFEAGDLELLVERLLAAAGRRLDRACPFADARLDDGSRLHVAIPPVVDEWALNIRKFVGLGATTLTGLVAAESLTPAAARFLAEAVRAGLGIVVSGRVGAGKTTLLDCLGAAIPPRQRVVTCEEVFELGLAASLPDAVAMQCRAPNLEGVGEIPLRTLVRESLRMRPDRLVIGEVRGAECFDLLVAMNSGCAGLTTVHANSAREALRKLTTLPLLAGDNVDRDFVAATVAAVVDVVVHTERDAAGRRRVGEILGVTEQVGGRDAISAGTIYARDDRGRLAWTGQTLERLRLDPEVMGEGPA